MKELNGRFSRRDLLKIGSGLAVGAGVGYGIAKQEDEPYKINYEEYTDIDAELFYKVISDYLKPDQNARLWEDAFNATQPVNGGKAREMFSKFHATNDLVTSNILQMSYRQSKSNNERNTLSIHIAEPDGFKQKSTEAYITFRYSDVLDVNELKTNAMTFFKLPQEVSDGDWNNYDPKMVPLQGQYKRVTDQMGSLWLLEAVEFYKNEVNDKGNNVYESQVRLIREYPATDPTPHYFIPTPIVR